MKKNVQKKLRLDRLNVIFGKFLIFFALFLLGLGQLAFSHERHSSIGEKPISNAELKNVYVDNGVSNLKKILPLNFTREKSFQLFSHGKPGYLLINNEWKNAKQIAEFAKSYLKSNKKISHINIYGCDFAKGSIGAEAVRYLEKELNVSVAASNNITGKDGDWVLEVGKQEDVIALPVYSGNLNSITVMLPQNQSFGFTNSNTNIASESHDISSLFSLPTGSLILTVKNFQSASGYFNVAPAGTGQTTMSLSGTYSNTCYLTAYHDNDLQPGVTQGIVSAGSAYTLITSLDPGVYSYQSGNNYYITNTTTTHYYGTASGIQWESSSYQNSVNFYTSNPGKNGISSEHINLTITVDIPCTLTAPNISAYTVCSGSSITLPSSNATGTLNWYSNVALTSPISGTIKPASSTTYYATVSSGGCTSPATSVPINVVNCIPDLTPNLTINPSIAAGVTNVNVKVDITEVRGYATSGLITVQIPTSGSWTMNLNPNSTQGIWTYIGNVNGNYTFTTSNSIAARNSAPLQFVASLFTPNNNTGVFTFSVQVVAGSGGETNSSNNTDSEILNYFPN